MAKPNYAFAKRQRELAKKQKLDQKRLRKAAGTEGGPGEDEPGVGPDGEAAAPAENTGGDAGTVAGASVPPPAAGGA